MKDMRLTQVRRQERYGIKKLSVGVASVLVATTLYFLPGSAQVLAASQANEEASSSQLAADAGNQVTPAPAGQADAGQADGAKPADQAASAGQADGKKPADASQAAEGAQASDASPADSSPNGSTKPSDGTNPADRTKPTDSAKPADTAKPAVTPESGASPTATPAAAPQVAPANQAPEIPAGHFRMHFAKLPSDNISEIGAWVWGNGVQAPSNNWPTGAMRFSEDKKTAYGYYLDVPVTPQATAINYLLNNVNDGSKKFTEDLSLAITNPQMKQAWLDENYQASVEEPIPANKNRLRVHYHRADGQYDNWGLWVWGKDVEHPSSDWPKGALEFNQSGPFGRYLDLPITELGKDIHFLLVNKATSKQTKDMSFSDRANHEQVYLHDEEDTVYTTPFKTLSERITRAEVTAPHQVLANFTAVDQLDLAKVQQDLAVTTNTGQPVKVTKIEVDAANKRLILTTEEDVSRTPLKLTYHDETVNSQTGWKLTDSLYNYQGELGSTLQADGSALMRLWAPSADAVTAVLYDKDNPDQVLARVPLTKDASTGLWTVTLDGKNTPAKNLDGYFYHYQVERGGQSVLVLDPYAKSLAKWDQATAKEKVAKAAIVDPNKIGPKLSYANIPGFKKREDAVIYEAHVRDFTSDPKLEGQLKSPFGTFSAFAERLSYLKQLGVTHIQLLPVMSYYFANESARAQRELQPSTQNNNYNWGYDPQSYFSLSGMYASDPSKPQARIEEFKQLIKAIHDQGMGVIMDVVYNHTAKTHLFEDIEPGYYHFMNADGSPRESFGGGRLGTTHKMARRVLVDSIKYWTDTFKVDGFRFDMMGDHDAEAIAQAYRAASALNPKVFMLGEGWRTFVGDEGDPVQAADQDWMRSTDGVAVFSDEIRNELKSGYPSEGQPRFLTGGPRNVYQIFNNIIANPSNFIADAPGDVIQYIAAHDNLTLHDIIAQSIKKDPKTHAAEIHQRIRLGNLMILTSQGTPFIHSGQEMGRTKQLLDPAYKNKVDDDKAPYKTHLLVDEQGKPFDYPYFVHDSYDSSDIINRFDWSKVAGDGQYPHNQATLAYTRGLIALRKSTDAFRKGTAKEIADQVTMMTSPDIADSDNVIAYQAVDSNGDRYVVVVNADNKVRKLRFNADRFPGLDKAEALVDGARAGTQTLTDLVGVAYDAESVTLQPLTATILRIKAKPDQAPQPEPEQENQAPDRIDPLSVARAGFGGFGGDVAQAPAGQLPATGESQAPLSLWAAVMAGLGSLMVGLGLKKEREAQ